MERLFGLDAQLIFDLLITMLAVFVLFLLLSFLFFEPVKELLKKRQETVRETLDTAEQKKADAAVLKKEYEWKLQQADTEAQTVLRDARKRALENEKVILLEAKEEAARLAAKADAQIAKEKKQAMEELKQETVSIAAVIAAKVIAASMDEKLANKLIENTLKEMSDQIWQN